MPVNVDLICIISPCFLVVHRVLHGQLVRTFQKCLHFYENIHFNNKISNVLRIFSDSKRKGVYIFDPEDKNYPTQIRNPAKYTKPENIPGNIVQSLKCIAPTMKNACSNIVVQWLGIYSISRSRNKAPHMIDLYHAGKLKRFSLDRKLGVITSNSKRRQT